MRSDDARTLLMSPWTQPNPCIYSKPLETSSNWMQCQKISPLDEGYPHQTQPGRVRKASEIPSQVPILHPPRYRRERKGFCVNPEERQDVRMGQSSPDENLVVESLIHPMSVSKHETIVPV
jgi:hypothetical protein